MAFLVSSLIRQHRSRSRPRALEFDSLAGRRHASYLLRPACWVAIKSRNLPAVQSALGLHHPKPCSWVEGLASEEQLFSAPLVAQAVGPAFARDHAEGERRAAMLLGLTRAAGLVIDHPVARVTVEAKPARVVPLRPRRRVG